MNDKLLTLINERYEGLEKWVEKRSIKTIIVTCAVAIVFKMLICGRKKKCDE